MAEQLAEGTVTILFTDIEGSTDLGRIAGDRSAREVINRHDQLIRAQVAAHGGREIKALGDGFMIAFSSARRAITCAVAIQKEMNGAARSDLGIDLPVRMGLNSGEVILDGDDVFGSAVSAAARISAHARARQILVSEVVKTLVGSLPDIGFRDAGTKELKGFDEAWRLYEVTWIGDVSTARHRTPFVGREQERSQLTDRLDGLTGASGSLVLIGGEPGVGKTRLAEEIAAQGTRRGFRTLVGHCYDLDSPAPYLPFIELLEAAARDVDRDTFRLALGDAAGEIAKVMPQLHKLYDDIPPGLELPAEQERRYLFNSITEFLERAASARPLVLLLDDIHWADESSLLLLQNIAPKLESLPVLIIGTYRDLELDVNRPLARVLDDLVRRRLTHRISLKRFSEEGVRVLLERLGGSAPPEPLVTTIFEETDGNPFFVEEVFRHLADEGRVFDAGGGWRSDLDIGEVEVPESLRLVIGRRLERLSQGARKALTAAAVIGRTFEFRLLEAVAGLGDDELLDAIEDAQQLNLIEPLSTSSLETRYEIVHELIRQTLLSGVSAPRQQRLHLKVAEAIEEMHAEEPGERAAEILNHLYRSGGASPEKTLRYLLLAGERAQESAAFEDAQRFFEEALEAADPDDEVTGARALVGLGYAKRGGGSLGEAMAYWDEALTIYEKRGDHQPLGELASEVALQFGWIARWGDVIGTAARVLHLLGDERTTARGRLLALSGAGMSWADQHDAALPLYDEAFEIAAELGDKELLGQCYGVKVAHQYAYGMMSSAVTTGREAMALLDGTGAQMNYLSTLAFVTFALAALGRADEVEAHLPELQDQSEKLGFAGGMMFAHRAQMITDANISSSPAEFERAARADLELCEKHDQPWSGQSHTFIALARFAAGDIEGALDHVEIGRKDDLPGALYGWGLGTNLYLLGYARRTDDFLALWDTAQPFLPVAGVPNSIGRWALLSFAIEGFFALERYDDVAGLRDLLAEIRNTDQIYRFDGRILDSLHGLAASCSRDWDEAERCFTAALERSDNHLRFFEDAEVRRLFAAALLLKGDPADRPRIKEMLEFALKRHESRDMAFHASLVRDLIARAG